jgi:ABC-2 type transport system permease protein
MRNLFLVGKHEIINTLSKRSFWLLSIMLPALILFINVTMQLGTSGAFNDDRSATRPGEVPAEAPSAGLVDMARIINELPPGIPSSILQFYPDEETAAVAVRQGQIEHFFILQEDYLASGEMIFVSEGIQAFNTVPDQMINYIINYNLTGDPGLASAVTAPTALLQTTTMGSESPSFEDDPFTFIGPFGIMFIFFFLITMSSGFMLQSVTREKENRVVEVLLVSLNPRQLMFGKILGLSIVGLLQLFIWLGAGLLVLSGRSQILQTMSQFQLPPDFLVWGLLYFLFGYLTYASLMAAIGALSPTAREGGQFSFFALLPMMIPMMFNYIFIHYPNEPLAVILSIFPLTAPTAMMTRMAATTVPLWQSLVGLLLLAGTAYLFISLAARFFKADNLLSGASIQWKRLVSEFER